MRKGIFAIAATSFFVMPESAVACATCAKANNYGNYVVGEANTATTEVRSATEAINIGFDMMVAAIKAMTDNVTTELHKNSLVQKSLLDEYNRQEEQRAKAAYTLESKQFYEDRYGLENIPMSACEDWADANALQVAKEVTEEDLRNAIDEFFTEYREASPVDDWRYHERTLQFAEAGQVDLNKSILTNEDVQNAVEYVNQTIDPVPVYPIRPDIDTRTLNADERAIRAKIQTLNMRLDAPKAALKEQILLKAGIVGEEQQSIQGILEKRAYEALDPENLADVGSGSEMRSLRTLLRDQQYGLVMEYEILKSNLRRTRIMAMSQANNADRYREGYRALETLMDGEHAVD